jgi:hypothetical protein
MIRNVKTNTNTSTRLVVDFIEQLIAAMVPDDPMKAECYVSIATILYEPSVVELDSRMFGKALGYLKDASNALEDAMDIPWAAPRMQMKDLEDNIKLQTCRAKSMQIIQAGELLGVWLPKQVNYGPR